MFQRQGPAAYKANLQGTQKVCEAIGNPQHHLKFVHVAGTNGKGTVSHMVAAGLQSAGHKVGLFTSPHLVDFRERIRVNGSCITERGVVDFVERWQLGASDWGTPSFFELTFGMALDWFKREQCDIVVLETGMGGRLDSTNIIPTAEVCCLTNVGMDHQAFLGGDIRTIAREKAGIFKDAVPVVLGAMRPEAQAVAIEVALTTSSEVHFAKDVGSIPSPPSSAPKTGDSWTDALNRPTACLVLQLLHRRGWAMLDSDLVEGLWRHQKWNGQRGRWQEVPIQGGPLVVLDGAHNVDGVTHAVEQCMAKVAQRKGRLHVVWGAVSDKDQEDVLALLPDSGIYHWCAADIPRALPALQLANLRAGLQGTVCGSPTDALNHALSQASLEDVVWVGGSLFVVGDVLKGAPNSVADWPEEASLTT